MKRCIKLLALTLSVLLLFSSCIPAKELFEKLIIQAIGIDWQDDHFLVTLQVYFPQSSGGQSFVDLSKPNNKVVQGEGETILEAVQNAQIAQGKDAFYGHNELIVVGRDLAERGMNFITSFFTSFNNLRPNLNLLIADGKAQDVVRAQIEGGILPAHVLQKAASSGEDTGFVVDCTLVDVMQSLKGDGSEIYAPVVGVEKDESDKEAAVFEKTAIFQGGRMIGTLEKEETRGLMWINDTLTRATLVIDSPDYGRISAKITSSHTKRKAELVGDDITMKLSVNAHVTLGERVSDNMNPVSKEDVEVIERQVEDTIRQEMEHVLTLCLREKRADVFDFAREISFYEPGYYLSHEDDWPAALPGIGWDIVVKCDVDRLGIETK